MGTLGRDETYLIKGPDGHQYNCILRVAEGASFLSLDDQAAVFSEPAQRIYGLNQMAANIWCRLEERQTPSAISGELIKSGVAPRLAREYVDQAIRMWLKLGLLKIEYSANRSKLPLEHFFTVNVGKLKITIQTTSELLAQWLSPLFSDHVTPADGHGDIFHVVENDRLVHVFHNELNVLCCDVSELAPSLKAYITEQIVARSPPDVVFHAAHLVRGMRSILISGAPGAGKTTLALHLMNAEFEYRADDIVLIAPDGNVMGVPFAPTVKAGAWEVINKIYPELNDAIVHRRPDGKCVRYLKPAHIVRTGKYPVGWIIFIERNSDGPAILKPLGRVDALSKLMEGSFSPGGKLTYAACNAIKRTLVNANSFELTYSNATDACTAIVGLCDD
ncbi:MAG TPA: hypothetical protein VGM57_02865 [Pseudolabrys sp.]|jgi:hypothetical protein